MLEGKGKIKKKIKELKEKKKDCFFIENILDLLPSKVMHLEIEYSEKDFNNIIALLNRLKGELKNV